MGNKGNRAVVKVECLVCLTDLCVSASSHSRADRSPAESHRVQGGALGLGCGRQDSQASQSQNNFQPEVGGKAEP